MDTRQKGIHFFIKTFCNSKLISIFALKCNNMTNDKIIKLGTTLGLSFNEKDNFPDFLAKNWVVFNGCNGQRFRIDGAWSDDEIYEELGKSLILMGRRLQKMDINRVLSITGD